MSHDQYQQPAAGWPGSASAPGQTDVPGVPALSPADAVRSTRWRLTLGISTLVLACFSAYYSYTNTSALVRATGAIEAAGGHVPPSAMALAVAIVAIFCVLTAAYAGIGVWNIIARHSTAKAPLIAAVVLSSIAIVLIVLNMTRSSVAPTHLGALALNALIIARAAIVLRMKKVPAGHL
ncbi:hypothetical protein SPF06_20215 [Sinomonas sp. JGH33]|uniref:Uncharacterized protein n=1 Tax=Sinomonas terricola TaxID=3110330 RepID=A0ABU5TDA7_9MICC|nr:hypothetical protein [Sinomonas sp. JGH33]MEA5457056.1 hypothetical protein [Sinomonas sp. JGH33]